VLEHTLAPDAEPSPSFLLGTVDYPGTLFSQKNTDCSGYPQSDKTYGGETRQQLRNGLRSGVADGW